MKHSSKPTMSSLEASALLLSGGQTDDVEQANLIAEGKLLDPDRLIKSHFRRQLGFDCTISHDDTAGKWIVRDDELHITVRTPYSQTDDEANAQHLANACIKLKAKHDKLLNTPEAETNDND